MAMKRRPKKSRFRTAITNLTFQDLEKVTFRDSEILNLFLSGQRKILPRRKTGVSARHQRRISAAIKRARQMGFLGYRGQQR